MKIFNFTAVIATTMAINVLSSQASAAQWDVTITNLTHGNHFTPLLVTAHEENTHLFQLGQSASAALQNMAECGSLDDLLMVGEAGPADADTIANPAVGLLAPGDSTTATLMTSESRLTVVAMVLPTNDAFVGLEAQPIPAQAGTFTYYLNAYDAGTEANNELLDTSGCAAGMPGIPGAPGGDVGVNGSGVSTADSNTMIHVHRGVLGDADTSGGMSDLANTIHRWQNPVAKVVVTVKP